MVAKDIDEANEALAQTLPDSVRTGLEDELRKLKELNTVLSGAEDKSTIHQLRAKLRWARERLANEREAVRRKSLEKEVSLIQNDIRLEVERKERSR